MEDLIFVFILFGFYYKIEIPMKKTFHPVAKPPIGKGEERREAGREHTGKTLTLELGPFFKENDVGCWGRGVRVGMEG